MKLILTIITLLLLTTSAYAARINPEKYYQTQWCNDFNGEIEHVLPDKTRVDCLIRGYAIEVDFADKWAESVGQSLHYAINTSRKPGVLLIIESLKDCKYIERVERISDIFNLRIKLWTIGEEC